MAEGRRLERPRVSRRDLGLAGRCITSLPAFRDLRMVARGGFEPPTFTAWVTALQAAALAAMRPRHRMVGQVGVEPTKSPRSERGAFTSLTTARWCRRSDSNRHCAAPQTADSANWPTSASNGGPGEIRTLTERLLRSPHLPVVLPAHVWRSVRDSNPQPNGYGMAAFGTAGLPVGRTLRAIENGCETDLRYDSRDDRLPSERYDSAVSRKARVIEVSDRITQEGERGCDAKRIN
jgi:hypothetical protein